MGSTHCTEFNVVYITVPTNSNQVTYLSVMARLIKAGSTGRRSLVSTSYWLTRLSQVKVQNENGMRTARKDYISNVVTRAVLLVWTRA